MDTFSLADETVVLYLLDTIWVTQLYVKYTRDGQGQGETLSKGDYNVQHRRILYVTYTKD